MSTLAAPAAPLPTDDHQERGERPSTSEHAHPRLGYGACSLCSCPGFSGSGTTCARAGCSHHYDSHW